MVKAIVALLLGVISQGPLTQRTGVGWAELRMSDDKKYAVVTYDADPADGLVDRGYLFELDPGSKPIQSFKSRIAYDWHMGQSLEVTLGPGTPQKQRLVFVTAEAARAFANETVLVVKSITGFGTMIKFDHAAAAANVLAKAAKRAK